MPRFDQGIPCCDVYPLVFIVFVVQYACCTSFFLTNFLRRGRRTVNIVLILYTAHSTKRAFLTHISQVYSLDADEFPMFSVGWIWLGFRRDLDPCWFE